MSPMMHQVGGPRQTIVYCSCGGNACKADGCLMENIDQRGCWGPTSRKHYAAMNKDWTMTSAGKECAINDG